MTSALRVSTDTAAPPAASWRMTGTTRSISSPSQTGLAPGRVDSPPTSMIAAPSRRHVRAGRRGGRGIGELPAVGEAVGRGVDDAHDLRLVEPDGALAELQRRPRRGQRLPLRGHVVVEAVSRSPRPAPVRSTPGVFPSTPISSTAANQFSPPASRATLPSWPKGESTKAVGRRSVRMARAIARRDAVAARRRAAAAHRPARRARRSSRCTTARPAARRRPCGSSPMRIAGDRAVGAHHGRPAALGVGQRWSRRAPARFRPARRTRRAAPSACRPRSASRFRRAARSRRSARARPST